MTVISGTQVVTTVATGPHPSTVGVSPASGYVYVANSDGSDMTVLSGTRVIAHLPVGRAPVSIAANPANGLVYVANQNSRSISIIQEVMVYLTHHRYLPILSKH